MVKKIVHKNNEEPIKRLYRSRIDKTIAGVCGGIAEYFKIDPVWVRLISILLIFLDGIGIIAYIVLWILVPENPNQVITKKTVIEEKVSQIKAKINKKPENEETEDIEIKTHEKSGHIYIGVIIIVIGILFLLKTTFNWFNTQLFWGVLLIALGGMLLFKKH